MRLGGLGEQARTLAECLALHRRQPTFALITLLAAGPKGPGAFVLLDELAQREVLYPEHGGYAFSSVALQQALLAGMDDAQLASNHRHLGEALSALASDGDPALRIDAGWHLIQGGDELRGADLIAGVTYDSVTARGLLADFQPIGKALAAALDVFGKHRRSPYQRLPLLAALAQAGYYEDRSWGERYGDEALYVGEELCGLRTARDLRRLCGRWIALFVGIVAAWVRFHLARRGDRPFGFAVLMKHLFATVTTLTGTAALSFDGDRAERIGRVLEPFSVLPSRLTPVGIYEFCRAMPEIDRENQAVSYDAFDRLLARFQDSRYYPTLPNEARRFYVAGAHFVRASLGLFRIDGRGALESADALERTGFRLYALIASQLRFLYFTARGEFATAAVHRARVEIHAARVGSAWQVETWEAAALLLVYPQIGDVVGSTRLAHRLEHLAKTVPSLRRYADLARNGILLSRGDPANRSKIAAVVADYENQPPRSYTGWATTMGYVARGHSLSGDHAAAKLVCERALAHVTERDREYVLNFLTLDLELARAESELGRPDEGLRRVEALLVRLEGSDHRLARGLLHDARARIAFKAGRVREFDESFREVEECFLSTEEPALVAKCKHLADLRASLRDDLHANVHRPAPVERDRGEIESREERSGSQARTAVVGRGNQSVK
jgi:hypothetical protein